MIALARAFLESFSFGVRRPPLQDKPLPPPDPSFGKQVPMTGLWNALSEEQKAFVRAYRGAESVGNPAAFKPKT
jgi:hypothetical protein